MKLTREDLEAKIVEVYFDNPLDTLTLCVLSLANGFKVVGKSACVDPKAFDAMMGRDLAYEDAFKQIWQLEGYLLAQRVYEGLINLD